MTNTTKIERTAAELRRMTDNSVAYSIAAPGNMVRFIDGAYALYRRVHIGSEFLFVRVSDVNGAAAHMLGK